MSLDTPMIVAVAPNGARKTRADHPALPITSDEIAREAAACREAGASMLHLHVRDRDGGHLLDADAYREATRAVRAAVGDGLIVQITTEAVGRYAPPEQMAVVRAVRPEACTVAIREIVPDTASEAPAAEFLAWCVREAVVPQYILYDIVDLARFRDLRMRGVVPDGPASVIFVLGRYSVGERSDPSDLLPFLEAAGPALLGELHWTVCAFGPTEGACALTGALLGGHSRVGFENNMRLNDGTVASSNAALVEQLRTGLRWFSRPIADADRARTLLSEPPG